MTWTLLKAMGLFIFANLILTQIPSHDFDPQSSLSWLLPLGGAVVFFIYEFLYAACPLCGGNFALQRETTRQEIILKRPEMLRYRCRLCGKDS